MNLFAEQQWRNRHKEQTYGHEGVEGRRERVRCMERVFLFLGLCLYCYELPS